MPRVGLREVICVSLLLALSTNPVVEGLQTNETEPQQDLNDWKDKSATIIYHLPGLLTKTVRGKFTMRFLNLTETESERNEMKEKLNEMIRTATLGRLCKLLNHLALKLVRKIVKAKLKWMKHKMMKYRMTGLLPKMFSRVHVPRYKKRRNKIAKSLARHCVNQLSSAQQGRITIREVRRLT